MDTNLSPEQSLKLIESMIGQAKKSFHRISFYFLLWGILLTLAMVAQLVTARSAPGAEGWGWILASILGGIGSAVYGAREGRREQAETLADRVMMWLWMAFVITLFATGVGAGVAGYSTPVGSIIILTGLPTFTTGQLIRFKPLIFGGVLFWVLGVISFFVEPFIMGMLHIVSMVFGYIIPGIMLKRQENGLRTA
ncbi:MAG: hypothetical protein JNL43_13970 [Flavobacteriales bacterium]|nr:hypothetical protein [Flavobacteriales bacterium]HRH70294.1 hypothetical protein [Flavobacteriales bacterium]